MKIIDLSISNAFRRMKAAFRTNAEVSRRTNLSEVHVSRILNGKTQYLSDETWTRVEPVLSRFMRKDDVPDALMNDPLFRIILENWPKLSAEDQGRLAGIVRGMVESKGDPRKHYCPNPECRAELPADWEDGVTYECPKCKQHIRFETK